MPADFMNRVLSRWVILSAYGIQLPLASPENDGAVAREKSLCRTVCAQKLRANNKSAMIGWQFVLTGVGLPVISEF